MPATNTRVDHGLGSEPFDELMNQRRHVPRWRRCVDDGARRAVGNVVLHRAVLPRLPFAATHAIHEPLVNLANQPLGDRLATLQIVGDQLKSAAVVQKLPHVVSTCLHDPLASPQLRRLAQRQLAALDVRGRVRLEQNCALAHPLNPFMRKRRRFQEPTCALNRCQACGKAMTDREAWREAVHPKDLCGRMLASLRDKTFRASLPDKSSQPMRGVLRRRRLCRP